MYIFSESFMKQLSNGVIFLVFKCEKKCESLCKQSQKSMKECSHGLGTKAIAGNVDMGNSTVPISSLGNVRKCEKM